MNERSKNWQRLNALLSTYEDELLKADDWEIDALAGSKELEADVRAVVSRALATRMQISPLRRRLTRPGVMPHPSSASIRRASPLRSASFGINLDGADGEDDDGLN
jgi:hypothetical protein